MAQYFAFDSFMKAFFHLILLGPVMGALLGLLGGLFGSGFKKLRRRGRTVLE
jgi:hypothetical protein